jgi:predicted Rossmann fold flavoprotein
MNPSPTQHWDAIIIGGGAAGFFAAITAAENIQSQKSRACVLILEKDSQVLKKVKISGGGRCNLTHACFDPKELAQHYPRGHQSLIGPFHRWGASDTVQWFESRNVPLKTENDGRIFPASDNSQTIIDCLTRSALQAGVSVQTSEGVRSITTLQDNLPASLPPPHRFLITTENGTQHLARSVLLATGGTRLSAGAKLATALGHRLTPDIPSLFSFNITDPRLNNLSGVSVPNARLSIEEDKLEASGPLLITHQGLSGPGILRLSAWGARQLHKKNHQFNLHINWLPDTDIPAVLAHCRAARGKQQVSARSPFESFPKRLWKTLCSAAGVPDTCLWSQLNKDTANRLTEELRSGEFPISGKSTNKDEFVTCGGVNLRDVNLKTMESKITPGLYFAGEILDIDGITGGFNFQNAWTTGYLAGSAISRLR